MWQAVCAKAEKSRRRKATIIGARWPTVKEKHADTHTEHTGHTGGHSCARRLSDEEMTINKRTRTHTHTHTRQQRQEAATSTAAEIKIKMRIANAKCKTPQIACRQRTQQLLRMPERQSRMGAKSQADTLGLERPSKNFIQSMRE